MKPEVLLTSPLFTACYPIHSVLERIRPFITEVLFEADELLVEQGQTLSGLYVLLGGHVKHVTTTPDGNQRLLAVARPVCYIGEEMVLDQQESQYSLVAATDVRALFLSMSDVQRLVLSDHEFSRSLMLSVANKVRVGYKGLIDGSRPVRERFHCLLHHLARQQGPDQAGTTAVSVEGSQQLFADWLGVSRYTITQELAFLKEQAIVEIRRGSVRILSPDRLCCQMDQRYCISKGRLSHDG